MDSMSVSEGPKMSVHSSLRKSARVVSNATAGQAKSASRKRERQQANRDDLAARAASVGLTVAEYVRTNVITHKSEPRRQFSAASTTPATSSGKAASVRRAG